VIATSGVVHQMYFCARRMSAIGSGGVIGKT
jgi:hypothetical protein